MPVPFRVMFAVTMLLVFAACKKDNMPDLTKSDIPSLFWVQSETVYDNSFKIVKGTYNSAISQSVYTLYQSPDRHYITLLATNRGSKDLFWTDTYIKKNGPTMVVNNIVRGDTLGLSADTIYHVEKAVDAMAINQEAKKIYWAEYDTAVRRDAIYAANLDGTNKTRLYADASLDRVSQLAFDSLGTTLYFLQNTYSTQGTVLETSAVWKGNANGSGMPQALYSKKEFSQSLQPKDLLIGVAIKGSDLYIATQSQNEDGNGICYLVKGNITGTAALTTLLSSTPAAAHNPLKMVMNLSLNKEETYLYWLNQGMPDNGSTGSIYRLPLAAPNKPELLLSGIAVAPWVVGTLGLGQ